MRLLSKSNTYKLSEKFSEYWLVQLISKNYSVKMAAVHFHLDMCVAP